MVNTVGSYENIYWQKKWIKIKRPLILDDKQKSLVIGSLLGDGTMRLGKKAINANFKVEHGLAQKDFVIWKYQILKAFVFTKPKISYRYNVKGEKYPKSWWFRTIRHPLLTEIYRRFYIRDGYRNGRKIIPPDLIKDFNPLILAIWVMDDGSFQKNKINISTYSFSVSDMNLLKKCFQEKFDITMNSYRDRDKGYRIYCNKTETKKLITIIQDYVISSMRYKIGFRNPVTTGFPLLAKKRDEDRTG